MSAAIGFEQILRTYIPADCLQERIADLTEYCRKTGCRDVMIFTNSYDCEISFKTPEAARQYTESTLIPAAAALRAAGIRVHLNVMQTLGHVFFPEEAEKEFPFTRRIAMNGHASRAGACPLDKNLQQWIGATYQIYASVRPDTLWVDDDFRTMLDGGMYCFCENHLKEYSKAAGYPVTREMMSDAILSDAYPASPLRQVYFDVTTAAFCNLAAIIHQSVKTVSPATQIGVMCAVWPNGAAGIDWDPVLKALSGTDAPLVRPQCPVYSEWDPRSTALSPIAQDLYREMMPANTIHWPELDCYPCSNYAKSDRSILTQLYGQMLLGFNHHAVQFFAMDASRFAEIEAPTDKLCKYKRYFDAIHEAIAEGSRPGGVYCYRHKKGLLVRRSTKNWLSGHKLDDCLFQLGLPIGYSAKDSPFCVASGDDLLAASDEEIDALLKRGMLLDMAALEALTLRGYGDRIGVDCSEKMNTDRAGYERFTGPDGKPRVQAFRACLWTHDNWRVLKPRGNGKFQIDSVICGCNGEAVGPMLVWSENAQGERFAVFATDMEGADLLMRHRHRAEQLYRTFQYLAGRPVPATGDGVNAFLGLFLNRDGENNPVLGVLNASTDRYDTFQIRIAPELAARKVEYLDLDGVWKPAPVTLTPNKAGYTQLKAALSLGTLEFATLRFR